MGFMGCELFFISDKEINGSFEILLGILFEYANSSSPNRVNIPLTSLNVAANAPKARFVAHAAVKAPPEKKIYARGGYIRAD